MVLLTKPMSSTCNSSIRFSVTPLNWRVPLNGTCNGTKASRSQIPGLDLRLPFGYLVLTVFKFLKICSKV